ncbi:MAG: ABC transporter ATP-binding protein [Alphaproteobacteria bacterium]
MTKLELNKIEKVYPNGFKAIHGIDLQIQAGEFIVFVGPSGCGKSTLLRMIAGLEAITQGEMKLNDKVINKVIPADRDVAMVFQNYALYPHMSVFGNMAYGLKNRGFSKTEIEQRVQEAADILQIGNQLQKKPHQLSGGQRQRVAMGRAIVRQPELFLFDEPLSNLDAKLRTETRVQLRKLHDDLNATTIYVTHDQVEAMTMASRIVVLNAGRIEQVGTPNELYNHPKSKFVADFLGSPSMNFFNPAFLDYAPNDAVEGGIRPERLHLEHTPERDGTLNVVIDFIEDLGADYLLHCAVNNGERVVVKAPARLAERYSLGQEIPLYYRKDITHFFDKDGYAIQWEYNGKTVI